MISNRTIVCLASDWDYDPTSKHQVMRVLSRYNHVVWVNYRGTRWPAPTRADFRNVVATLRQVTRGVRRVSSRMVQVTPLVFPAPGALALKSLNEHLVVRTVRRALAQMNGAARDPVQVWSFAPDTAFLAGRFNEERFVYYCVDEHAQFEGFNPEYITREERAQLGVADVVITTSSALYESKGEMHPNVHLVRHGVDTEHFGSALEDDTPVPDDLETDSSPVVGFFGVLHHWVDCALLAEVARLRPHYTFVLIGEVLTDVGALRNLPNVRLLGRRPYATLPGYCKGFDAALLPFKHNAMTRSVNPIKMREYLAAGLPVVSTPLPEARVCEPDVIIADGAAAFARGCDTAIEESPRRSPELAAARVRRVAGDSWEAVAERLSGIVMQAAPAKTVAATPSKLSGSVDSKPVSSVA
ncbi:MAG: glycosyltransferase family 1 protein [bacterium]|nr:glycosyltransferase family 1 protein [bacterium]